MKLEDIFKEIDNRGYTYFHRNECIQCLEETNVYSFKFIDLPEPIEGYNKIAVWLGKLCSCCPDENKILENIGNSNMEVL